MQLPSLIGKYELLEFLGGGMSHVYRARDTVIERPVVVKILTEESAAEEFLEFVLTDERGELHLNDSG